MNFTARELCLLQEALSRMVTELEAAKKKSNVWYTQQLLQDKMEQVRCLQDKLREFSPPTT